MKKQQANAAFCTFALFLEGSCSNLYPNLSENQRTNTVLPIRGYLEWVTFCYIFFRAKGDRAQSCYAFTGGPKEEILV